LRSVALRRLDVNQWRQRSFVLHSNEGDNHLRARTAIRPMAFSARCQTNSEALMVRVLCLLLAMILSDMCSALEIHRVAACSGVVLRLRGDFRDGVTLASSLISEKRPR
jgi:hypothetical protein